MSVTPGNGPVKKRTAQADWRQRQRPTHTRSDTTAPTAENP
jgi:hypothetical protein